MPTFNAYPQNFNVVDMPAIQAQATQRQLQEAQLQKMQGEVQRQGQLRGLMPGVGAEAGLGPKGQEALGLDPSMLSELLKIPKAKRDQAKAKVERIGKLLQAVETAPPVQRPQIYAMARQQYAVSGDDVSKIPETYDPAWVQTKLAEAGKLMAVLKQVEKKSDVLSPEAEAQKIRIAQARGPLVSIGGQEKSRAAAAGKALGEHEGETYVNIQKAGRASREQDARLDRLDQLLDQTETGFGAEFLTKLRKVDIALGWNVVGDHESVAPAEASMALSNEMALQLRNPAGGAGMPGQLSDKDREFLVTMVPGLGQTRAGRKLLIRARKKMNKRTREVAKRARAYFDKHGTLGVGFENELSDWSDKNPIFTTADMTAREAARLPHIKPGDPPLPSGTYFVDPNNEIRIAS